MYLGQHATWKCRRVSYCTVRSPRENQPSTGVEFGKDRFLRLARKVGAPFEYEREAIMFRLISQSRDNMGTYPAWPCHKQNHGRGLFRNSFTVEERHL